MSTTLTTLLSDISAALGDQDPLRAVSLQDEAPPLLVISCPSVAATDLTALAANVGPVAAIEQAARTSLSAAQLGGCSLVVGTLDDDVASYDLGLAQLSAFIVNGDRRTLKGYAIPAPPALVASPTAAERAVMASRGIQSGMLRGAQCVLEHEYSLARTPGREVRHRPECYLHVLRVRQLLFSRLREVLWPYGGRTLAQIPPLGPLIAGIIAEFPAIREASYDLELDPLGGRLQLTLQVTLVNTLSFQLLVSTT